VNNDLVISLAMIATICSTGLVYAVKRLADEVSRRGDAMLAKHLQELSAKHHGEPTDNAAPTTIAPKYEPLQYD
jgi:hypothetical protein